MPPNLSTSFIVVYIRVCMLGFHVLYFLFNYVDIRYDFFIEIYSSSKEVDSDFWKSDCFYLLDFEDDLHHVLVVDDYVHVLDFEKELEHVVEVEELFQDAHGSSAIFASISILEGAYFQHSNSK